MGPMLGGRGCASLLAVDPDHPDLAGEFDDGTFRSLVPSGDAEIARLVPDLAARLGESTDATHAIESDAERFYLFEAVATCLTNASSAQPLVLVLDDLFDADRSSLLLLRFLVRDVRKSRMLVVATYREAEPASPSPEAEDVLAALAREGTVIGLRGLDREEVGRLVEEVSGTLPAPAKVSAIHEATEGNPLFVREVTRLEAVRDPLDRQERSSISIPQSVRAVIRRRISPLPADAFRVLSVAAVVGRDFDLRLVSAASDFPADRARCRVGGRGAGCRERGTLFGRRLPLLAPSDAGSDLRRAPRQRQDPAARTRRRGDRTRARRRSAAAPGSARPPLRQGGALRGRREGPGLRSAGRRPGDGRTCIRGGRPGVSARPRGTGVRRSGPGPSVRAALVPGWCPRSSRRLRSGQGGVPHRHRHRPGARGRGPARVGRARRRRAPGPGGPGRPTAHGPFAGSPRCVGSRRRRPTRPPPGAPLPRADVLGSDATHGDAKPGGGRDGAATR